MIATQQLAVIGSVISLSYNVSIIVILLVALRHVLIAHIISEFINWEISISHEISR